MVLATGVHTNPNHIGLTSEALPFYLAMSQFQHPQADGLLYNVSMILHLIRLIRIKTPQDRRDSPGLA